MSTLHALSEALLRGGLRERESGILSRLFENSNKLSDSGHDFKWSATRGFIKFEIPTKTISTEQGF